MPQEWIDGLIAMLNNAIDMAKCRKDKSELKRIKQYIEEEKQRHQNEEK